MASAFVPPPCELTPQAASSPTFRLPPLDGTCTVPELFEYNAQHSPEHPIFTFVDQTNETVSVTYRRMWNAIRRVASTVRSHVEPFQARYDQQERPIGCGPTVGILAAADSITYSVLMLAIMRLGFIAFPLSTRNSASGLAHLIQQTHVIQLYVSSDPAMQRLGRETVDALIKDGYAVQLLHIDIFDPQDTGVPPEMEFPKLELDNLVCIYHSSGSSSFPKPISFSNSMLLHLAMVPFFGEVDLCGVVVGMHVAPIFHAMGLSNLTWPATSGMIIGVFRPSSPPVAPTPKNYLDGIIATESKILLCVPSFVEAWFTDETAIPALKSLRAILYAGAPLNKSIGDRLIKMGVALFPSYGSTETGALNKFIPSALPALDEWEYFQTSPHLDVRMLPQPGYDDVVEIAVTHTPYFKPNVINYNWPECEGYRTGDLLQRHPTDPTRWRVFGRADDQILLVTGEKTNPIPLEAILLEDEAIAGAVMFGTGHPENGVIIEPKNELVFDLADLDKLVEFRLKIWPSVERLNRFAPAHSRILKEMILVASSSKPFEYTAKGTAKRQAVLKLYSPEIDNLYDTANVWQSDIPLPSSWSTEGNLDFVRAAVTRAVGANLDDDVDVFQYGCDSLQATHIRRAVASLLQKSLNITPSRVPQSLVYDHPTITSLANVIAQLRLPSQNTNSRVEAISRMEAMLDKYSDAFYVRPDGGVQDQLNRGKGGTVLATGTTGRLGCHVLAQLLKNQSIDKVYALNRDSEGDMADRQRAAFGVCGLDSSLLESPKLCLQSANFADPHLGLDEKFYQELIKSVTGIIHIAWQVNFKMSLASFEPLVAGVRNLIDLALASPLPTRPSILFTSSISVFSNQPASPIKELAVSDPEVALGIGYGESKWVAENLLLRASEYTGLRTHIVRVGQLCGDSVIGAWNENEWLPALVRGAQILGAVPQTDEEISWIPLDVAASVLLDISANGATDGVFHLVHPSPAHWSTFSNTAAKTLGVPSIPYRPWVDMLQRAGATDPRVVHSNPALRLVDFFVNYRGAPLLSTERTLSISPTLRITKQLTGEDVERWILNWRKTGFLSQ
ncbi:acetyl-CoA synthetase-like protein [Mycena polygramma]|nr:acetyl-CoA synthetase-like protein [Mycena polygramma]